MIVLFIRIALPLPMHNSLSLFCDCEPSAICYSNGVVNQEINDSTVLSIDGCDNLIKSDIEELQLSWMRNGFKMNLREFENLTILKIFKSILYKLDSELFTGLHKLKKFMVTGNKIEELKKFPELKSLKKLFLADNNLEMISNSTFANLVSLMQLTLEDNQIIFIEANAFKENANLVELNLNRNDLRFLEQETFKNNFNLLELSLNHNELDHLPIDIFSKNVRLEVLRLHGNKLKILQRNLFINNEALKWIELGANDLFFIDSNVFRNLKRLRFADLASNVCIDDSYPIEMNFEHLLKLIKRNCHYLAAVYYEFI